MGGADKAFLTVNGETVFQRTLHLLRRCFPEVVVVSNRPEKYRGFDIQVAADEFAGKGPLAGIHAALGRIRLPYAFVVACDMPFASPEILLAELALLRETGVDAVVPHSEGGMEPFHAVYRVETCLPHVQAAIQAGMRRADAWFGQANVRYMDGAEIHPYDPDGVAFFNINTPEELKEGEELAREDN